MRTLTCILAAALSAGCLNGPTPIVGGVTLGVCSDDRQMACDHTTGQAYFCQGGRWGRLTGCPDGGCPYAVDLADGGTEWPVCSKEDASKQ